LAGFCGTAIEAPVFGYDEQALCHHGLGQVGVDRHKTPMKFSIKFTTRAQANRFSMTFTIESASEGRSFCRKPVRDLCGSARWPETDGVFDDVLNEEQLTAVSLHRERNRDPRRFFSADLPFRFGFHTNMKEI
jgi:hypothetical protein